MVTEHFDTPIEQAEVTRLLDEIQGSPELFDRLLPMVYDDLKRIGRAQRRRFGGGATLQTTALVHEAFLKLRGNAKGQIENRLHFQRLAACVMRQLILDYARKHLAAKRGGDQVRETFEEADYGIEADDLARIIAVEEALERMADHDRRMTEALAAQLYAGYTVEEIGEIFGISSRTVIRDLRRARVWLKVELVDFERD
ncbi:MAG: sigma-70 family RNA polymerase sigma factor [Xanthomonadaceae bacterium]|nr:sigma-70 family RNA polymerase sigma factor [Xanthomonadaceae bacterium]